MGFKIGDRVRVAPNGPGGLSRYTGMCGTVMPYSGRLFDYSVRLDGDYAELSFHSHELVPASPPISPRGPKPLTLTGGRPRFTVRRGYAMDRAGFRRYPLDSYLSPFTGAKG